MQKRQQVSPWKTISTSASRQVPLLCTVFASIHLLSVTTAQNALPAFMTEIVKVCEFTKSVCAAECIVTSGSKRSRIFTSLTLLCATMKQRPCRDMETINYSSSIKHKYHVHVTLIHVLLRKKLSLFLSFFFFVYQGQANLISRLCDRNVDELITDHSSSTWSELSADTRRLFVTF